MMTTVLRVLPERLKRLIDVLKREETEELRLRLGRPVCLVCSGREIRTDFSAVTKEEIQYVLAAASENSLYAVNDTLKDGYLTLPGGHRIGICGHTVMEKEEVRTLKDISSVSIRIAREKQGIGVSLTDSALILGPPGCGKTTLLRDCLRVLSDIQCQRISLVDERGEIAACSQGIPQMQVGQRTDILTGCPKDIGIMMMLRSMNPQWIAVDEITKEDDVDAILRASYCGVKLLGTAHAWSKDDLIGRPVYRKLLENKIFREILLMEPNHSFRRERIDIT